MKVALVGDSITLTWYLNAADNPALVTYHGKTSSYNYRLDKAIEEKLVRTDITIGQFARGGWTAYKALTEDSTYQTGVFGSPINLVAPMWDAVKSWNPDLVIFGWGNNDAGAYSLATFEGYLRSMFDDCVELGIDAMCWNGQSVQWGPDYDDATAASRRSYTYPFYDKQLEIAREYGFDTVDMRSAWKLEQDAGNWDLFCHTDATYLASINIGVSDPTKLYYDIHPWIAGQDITSRVLANYLDYGPYDLDVILEAVTQPLPAFDVDVILEAVTPVSSTTPPANITEELTATVDASPRTVTTVVPSPRQTAAIQPVRYTASVR